MTKREMARRIRALEGKVDALRTFADGIADALRTYAEEGQAIGEEENRISREMLALIGDLDQRLQKLEAAPKAPA